MIGYPLDHLTLPLDATYEESQKHAANRKQNEERSKTQTQPVAFAVRKHRRRFAESHVVDHLFLPNRKWAGKTCLPQI